MYFFNNKTAWSICFHITFFHFQSSCNCLPLITEQLVAAWACWLCSASSLSKAVISNNFLSVLTMESVSVWLWQRSLSLSSCPYHCSVSDVVLRVEVPPAGDGGLVQRVAVWLTVVIVDRQIFHVHRPLWLQRLQMQMKSLRQTKGLLLKQCISQNRRGGSTYF